MHARQVFRRRVQRPAYFAGHAAHIRLVHLAAAFVVLNRRAGMRVYADDRHRRFRAAQRLSRVADDRVADRAAQPQHLAGDQQRALLSLLQQQCPGV